MANSILLDDKKIVPSKVICVGRNYVLHIEEMGGVGIPEIPTIFLKPNSAITFSEKISVPEKLGLLHHEVELCFVVHGTCKNISEKDAAKHIAGFSVGLDLTLRDLQSKAKKSGSPWDLSKGFDNAAVFGKFTSKVELKDMLSADISLHVNGKVRQNSNTSLMIFSPARVLSFVSSYMTIDDGDVFMCGTPDGVAELVGGDVVEANIQRLSPLKIKVERK